MNRRSFLSATLALPALLTGRWWGRTKATEEVAAVASDAVTSSALASDAITLTVGYKTFNIDPAGPWSVRYWDGEKFVDHQQPG